VKTYAHSLRLQQERLEDLAVKRSELERRIDEKRLELLTLKKNQLDGLRQQDPELEKKIAELSEKVRNYAAPPVVPETPKGMIKLGRKNADGSISRLESEAPTTSAASAAE
jgi:hypothetical protein